MNTLSRGPRKLTVLRARAGRRGRRDPVVDHRLGVRAGVAAAPSARRARHRGGGRRADPRVRALRARGHRHAGAGRADAAPRRRRALPLRPQPDVHRGRRRVVGQAGLFGQPALLVYAAALLAIFVAFVRGYEEPTLSDQFGAEYDAYRRAVPGWWPRARPAPSPPARAEEQLVAGLEPDVGLLGVRPRRARQDPPVLARREQPPVAPHQHARPPGLEHRAVGVEQQRRAASSASTQPPVDPLVLAEPAGQHVRRQHDRQRPLRAAAASRSARPARARTRSAPRRRRPGSSTSGSRSP